MSRRRYISSEISTDIKVARLADHGSLPLLLYTWAIPHMDDWGRMSGDPVQFKLLVCPALNISTADVQEAIEQVAQAELWELYAVDGKPFIAVPEDTWFKHQTYINKAKRTDDSGSKHPSPKNAAKRRRTPKNAAKRRKTPKNAASPSPSPSPSSTSPNGGQADKRPAGQRPYTDTEKRPVQHLKSTLERMGIDSLPNDWHLKGYAVSRQMQSKDATPQALCACIDWMIHDAYWSQNMDSMSAVRGAWAQFKLSQRERDGPPKRYVRGFDDDGQPIYANAGGEAG